MSKRRNPLAAFSHENKTALLGMLGFKKAGDSVSVLQLRNYFQCDLQTATDLFRCGRYHGMFAGTGKILRIATEEEKQDVQDIYRASAQARLVATQKRLDGLK